VLANDQNLSGRIDDDAARALRLLHLLLKTPGLAVSKYERLNLTSPPLFFIAIEDARTGRAIWHCDCLFDRSRNLKRINQ
jgi:hypothetical protein